VSVPSVALLVPIAVFALDIAVMVLRAGSNTLDRLPLLPGEHTVSDDADARFAVLPHNAARYNRYFFARAFIRLTDQRVIVCQPALFRPGNRVVRYVVYYRTQDLPADTPALYEAMYASFVLGGSRVTEVQGRPTLELTPFDPSNIVLPRLLLLRSPRQGEYLRQVAATA
jgi:hypothetical protein